MDKNKESTEFRDGVMSALQQLYATSPQQENRVGSSQRNFEKHPCVHNANGCLAAVYAAHPLQKNRIGFFFRFKNITFHT